MENNDIFRNKYRIPSARAEWHDYNGGVYFITICTTIHFRQPVEIRNGGPTFVWQTRFHDHIIRDAAELNRIVRYIDNNVANWDS